MMRESSVNNQRTCAARHSTVKSVVVTRQRRRLSRQLFALSRRAPSLVAESQLCSRQAPHLYPSVSSSSPAVTHEQTKVSKTDKISCCTENVLLCIVLLRIPNPQPNPRILPESVRVRIHESFAAVSKRTRHRRRPSACYPSPLSGRSHLRLALRRVGRRTSACVRAPHLLPTSGQALCLMAGVYKFIMPSSGIRNRVPVSGFFHESVRLPDFENRNNTNYASLPPRGHITHRLPSVHVCH